MSAAATAAAARARDLGLDGGRQRPAVLVVDAGDLLVVAEQARLARGAAAGVHHHAVPRDAAVGVEQARQRARSPRRARRSRRGRPGRRGGRRWRRRWRPRPPPTARRRAARPAPAPRARCARPRPGGRRRASGRRPPRPGPAPGRRTLAASDPAPSRHGATYGAAGGICQMGGRPRRPAVTPGPARSVIPGTRGARAEPRTAMTERTGPQNEKSSHEPVDARLVGAEFGAGLALGAVADQQLAEPGARRHGAGHRSVEKLQTTSSRSSPSCRV